MKCKLCNKEIPSNEAAAYGTRCETCWASSSFKEEDNIWYRGGAECYAREPLGDPNMISNSVVPQTAAGKTNQQRSQVKRRRIK